MNYLETLDYINSFTKSGKPVKDLSRIRKLLNLLDNPQKDLKFIHVAGTNGKGSTVEMISNALRFSGYNVGTFTSPFMVCYEDRIRFNNQNISSVDLCKYASIVKSFVTTNEFSQFEISMAIAFLYYKAKRCDIVVLETGIGGVVDSTNIIENTIVSVVTSISFDHTAILGDTLPKIATQKAGIIKPNRPVVLSNDNTNQEVIEVISNYAQKQHSKLYIPKVAQIVDTSIHGETFIYNDVLYSLKMLGKHQVANASTVIETCNVLNSLGYDITCDSVKKSLKETQVRFRTEVIQNDDVLIIADGSHNIGGVTALKDTLKSCNIDNVTILTGMISTKDYKSCCKVLDTIANSVVCTDDFIYNAIPKDELSKLFTKKVEKSSLSDALNVAKTITKEEKSVLVVCGSLYLLSKIFND